MPEFEWIPPESFGNSDFQTEWFTVKAAQQGGAGATAAMEKLCITYWYPLYAYARGKGHGHHEAQDLTQEFFSGLLAKTWLENVDPAKGKFRAFLLAAMNNFLANEWRRGNTAKRGKGNEFFSLEAAAAEQRFQLEPFHHDSPDRLFDRAWAAAVSAQVLARLREEYAAAKKTALFDGLKNTLTREKGTERQADLARRLGLSESAVRKAAQRLREGYLDQLRAEIAVTVSNPAEVDEEVRHVLSVLNA